MQFINNGPDIPNELLNEHENGNVVFFCGAGISYPAGLPSFKGLVDNIYEKIGDMRSLSEKNAYDNSQLDIALNLLQKRIVAGRKSIFNAIYESLQPSFSLPGSIDTHVALLKLSITKENKTHLITSNFDRVFEKAKEKINKTVENHIAPYLPTPDQKWDSLVYLHGILPYGYNENSWRNKYQDYDEKNDNLIFTSGDFGQAYLIKRWASDFVNKVLETYTICFVGYSLNDPILRYMMDALTANEDYNRKAYIFSDYQNNEEKENKQQEWKDRGIIPIFYEVNNHNHEKLHNTLIEWGNLCGEKGTIDRSKIIDRYIKLNPKESTDSNDFIGRILWALSGQTASIVDYYFLNKHAPSFQWLNVLINYNNNNYFANSVNALFDDTSPTPWTETTGSIATWLCRQLNNDEVFKWIIDRGRPLHKNFQAKIKATLANISIIKSNNDVEKIKQITTNHPDIIPSDFMNSLWNLLINDQIFIYYFSDTNLYNWKQQFSHNGLTIDLQNNLRKIISPKINFLTDFRSFIGVDFTKHPKEWNIDFNKLSFGIDSDFIIYIETYAQPNDHIALINEFELALKTGLDLLNIFKKEKQFKNHDLSFLSLKSISPHPQDIYKAEMSDEYHRHMKEAFEKQGYPYDNRAYLDPYSMLDQGALMIVLIRDCWLKIKENNPKKAKEIALGWFKEPFSTFKRLALYAATQDHTIPDSIWVKCLLENNCEYLWAIETKKEKIEVLEKRGQSLNKTCQIKLEKAILKGREFVEGISQEEINHEIRQYLLALENSGLSLFPDAQTFLDRINIKYPNLKKPDESDKFVVYTIMDDKLPDELSSSINIPENDEELIQWLQDNDNIFFNNGSMDNALYTRALSEYYSNNPEKILAILEKTLNQSSCLPNTWRIVLNASSYPELSYKTWSTLCLLIQKLPGEVITQIFSSIAYWIWLCVNPPGNKPTAVTNDDPDFLETFEYIFNFIPNSKEPFNNDKNELYIQSLGHPIGQLSMALMNFWFKTNKLHPDCLVPKNIKLYLELILKNQQPDYLYGKFIIAMYTQNLYLIDPRWTKQYLLPLLDWNKYKYAWVIWCGYLIDARINNNFLDEIKLSFLTAAKQYQDIQKGGHEYIQHYTHFLINVALFQNNIFTKNELKKIFNDLPKEALVLISEHIKQKLPNNNEQSKDIWAKRLKPFWLTVWPKSKNKITIKLTESLVYLCLQSKQEFPLAISVIKDWLQPLDILYLITPLFLIEENKIEQQFPEETLELLSKIINQPVNSRVNLNKILENIKAMKPELKNDPRLQKLTSFLK